MPRPVFILCSKSGVEDKESSLISLFDIVEKLQITKVPIPQVTTQEGPRPPVVIQYQPLRIVAVWMALPEDDPQQNYDYSMIVFGPPKGEPIGVEAGGVFRFTKPLHRFTMRIEGPLPMQGPGLIKIESRIRKVGEENWLSQDYPIIVEEIEPAQENPPTH